MSRSFGFRQALLPLLGLLASAGTLVCCALPALMVSLGMGAALAGLVSAAPGLIWLSKYKLAVFAAAGLMIALSGFMMVRARRLPCPAAPEAARACARLRIASWWIWGFSALCFTVGAFFAFAAPYILVK